jgi:medium-chain acyl-[acyl-carrier-protein] hydrolase
MIELLHVKPFMVRYTVGFRAEALAGNTILARCVPEAGADAGGFLHEIVREKDGRELSRLHVSWA